MTFREFSIISRLSFFPRNEALRTWGISFLHVAASRQKDISSCIVYIFFSLCIAILKEERGYGNVNNRGPKDLWTADSIKIS